MSDVSITSIREDDAGFGDYFALLRPRVMSLVVFTALVGLMAAPVPVHPLIGFCAILFIAIGGEHACPVCRTTCSICDRPYCAEHSQRCKRCQQEYCSECVRLSGLCDVCAHIDRDGTFVALVDEPCARDVRVQLIMSNYRWVKLESTHLIHYVGRDTSMQAALIVVAKTQAGAPDGAEPGSAEPGGEATGPRVRKVAKLGMLDTPYRERWALS